MQKKTLFSRRSQHNDDIKYIGAGSYADYGYFSSYPTSNGRLWNNIPPKPSPMKVNVHSEAHLEGFIGFEKNFGGEHSASPHGSTGWRMLSSDPIKDVTDRASELGGGYPSTVPNGSSHKISVGEDISSGGSYKIFIQDINTNYAGSFTNVALVKNGVTVEDEDDRTSLPSAVLRGKFLKDTDIQLEDVEFTRPILVEEYSTPSSLNEVKGMNSCISAYIPVKCRGSEKTISISEYRCLPKGIENDLVSCKTIIESSKDSYEFESRNPKQIGNPFSAFICGLKSLWSNASASSDSDFLRLKEILLNSNYDDDTLLLYFRESISLANSSTVQSLVLLLSKFIERYHICRPLILRMMVSALAFHPDEFVRVFKHRYTHSLFDPEVDDDSGGGFLRLLLSYKATFAPSVILGEYGPTCLDDEGILVFEDFTPEHAEKTSYGRLESLEVLRICMDRAGVESAFDLPASRLRDWLCTIWYEMPATRPNMPLIRLCLYWIDSRVDPPLLKDAAFALMQKEKYSLGVLEGSRALLVELFIFMLRKNGDVHPEIERVIGMITESEDDFYCALYSIISSNFCENDMLDIWCLLCVIPLPVTSPDSPLCKLLSTLFRVFYNVALQWISGSSVNNNDMATNGANGRGCPLGLIENLLRICVCRCLSPIIAKGAILQTIMLIAIGPHSIAKFHASPLVMGSLCPFVWKCNFLWSKVREEIHPETLLALKHLYSILQKHVSCDPLPPDQCDSSDIMVQPIFPRIPRKSEEVDTSRTFMSFLASCYAEEKAEVFADADDVLTAGNVGGLDIQSFPLPQRTIALDNSQKICKKRLECDNPCGLRNLGNTCYYGSVIQALFHTRYFVYLLFQLDEEGNVLKSALVRLFKKMMNKRNKILSPLSSYKLLSHQFKESEQHDAMEVYRYISESLDETMDLWKSVFAGLLIRRVKCLRCGSLSDTEETILDFSFPPTNLGSVQDLFEDFCKVEHLTGENKYFCSNCGKYRKADMWNIIASPPAHLIVVLNRNNWQINENDQKKILKHVEIDNSLRICDFDYELYGSIIHSGDSANSGHYYFVGCDSESFCRWHVFDDSVVKAADKFTIDSISRDSSNSHVPYVVFYRCLQAPPTPQLT